MTDLLLELFSEEIPARLQLEAERTLKKRVTEELLKGSWTFEAAQAFSTPRRLVLAIEGLPEATLPELEEKRGPNILASQQAIKGFMKAINIKSSQLVKKKKKKGEFYFARIQKASQLSEELIPEILSRVVRNFPWPKSMRWGAGTFKWVRPLHSVMCLLSDDTGYKILKLDFDGILSSNISSGHRFLAPDEFSVSSFEDYQSKITKQHVILDRGQRKAKIWNEATTIAFAKGMEVVEDESLLEEVTGLVEYPVVLIGKIDEDFLTLPPEVLKMTMRQHQKYFSVRQKGSTSIQAFIMVANIFSSDDGHSVIGGNERVLHARLSDAKFFWENDLNQLKSNGFDAFAEKLKRVTFHNELGTESERVIRITEIACNISKVLNVDLESTKVAASLCKLDLVSEMVYEFPELQGVMGRCYAKLIGFSDDIADACQEHYLPQGPLDEVPLKPVSIAVALAEKVDMICNFWAINQKPTGSKDPFALRRASIGIIRILLENRLDIPLVKLLKFGNNDLEFDDLINFFFDRIRAHLIEKGIALDVLNSVISNDYKNISLKDTLSRAEAIQTFVTTMSGKDLIQGYKRAINIMTVEENRDGVIYSLEPKYDLMELPSEISLYEKLVQIDENIIQDLKETKIESALENLSYLRIPIDEFFNKVKINSENAIIRRNRLCLLNQIKEVMHRVAHFSEIDGER